MDRHLSWLRPLATTSIVLALAVSAPTTASAAPGFSSTGPSPAVGALPVDATVSSPPNNTLPASVKSSTGCRYPDVLAPNGSTVRHVAPCQTGTGNGTGSSPWRTISSAMANLRPGQVAYIHDGPQDVDYRESNLRPTSDGTGPNTRIRLMAAPGERPWIGRAPLDPNAPARPPEPIFHLTRPWWYVQGLNLDATNQMFGAPVVRVGSGAATVGSTHHVVLQTISSRNASQPKSVIEFDGAHNSALLDSSGSTPTGPVGLIEPLDANGRPRTVPTNGDDHHAITVVNGADKILIRNNESAGHNGDSFQCGEGAATSNITVVGNRFHQDEENGIDLKDCDGVTVSGNKLFGYRPARPYLASGFPSGRAPQGDALVVHQNLSTAPSPSAERVLIELNRFWDNSRSVNIGAGVPTATVRRNLIFNASTASCGYGAGMVIRSQNTEVYHNTLDNLAPNLAVTDGCGGSTSDKYAIRLDTSSGAPVVLWNNLVSRASRPYTSSGTASLDASRNLFPPNTPAIPAGSLTGDPLYVADPANNDYYTRQGSPARDAANPVPSAVGDPRRYCDDPSPNETDLLIEPDIGFLESCS